jgi:putative spermidine/putrescine transport system substrate-binding protein
VKGTSRATAKRWGAAAVAVTGIVTGFGFGTAAASTTRPQSSASCWATAKTIQACGGMSALVAAAKQEGVLNTITLPSNWANYGNIINTFKHLYGIRVTDANPDGSSAQEIQAVESLKGQSRAPDVLDLGTSFAIEGDQKNLLAPFEVPQWSDISSSAKAPDGTWYDDYGGYVAIGYYPKYVKKAPTSFKSLENPIYKGQVAMNGSPTEAGAAFAAVYAAALANGGSFNNILPGIKYYQTLHNDGIFVPVTGSEATVASGQTPVLIWWDYLQATEVKAEIPSYKIIVPSDAHYAGYYSQAISKYAPDPAAARLWEVFLYSAQGQNLWLEGYTRPIELNTMVSNHTVNASAYAKLPAVNGGGTLTLPTSAELAKAEALVLKDWSTDV